MNIAQEITKLNLEQGSYIVVGSGIMCALGLRDSNDIDIIVSEEVFEGFRSLGWKEDSWPDQSTLTWGLFEAGVHWYGEPVDKLLTDAQYVDNIPYLKLDDVYEWKKVLGRNKDIKDLSLIDAYRKLNMSL